MTDARLALHVDLLWRIPIMPPGRQHSNWDSLGLGGAWDHASVDKVPVILLHAGTENP